MPTSRLLTSEGERFARATAAMLGPGQDPGPSMKVVESRAGRIVVRHDDGYVFVFQIHDIDDLAMDLEDVTWSSIGAPPDADELELQARATAEVEARARGWLT